HRDDLPMRYCAHSLIESHIGGGMLGEIAKLGRAEDVIEGGLASGHCVLEVAPGSIHILAKEDRLRSYRLSMRRLERLAQWRQRESPSIQLREDAEVCQRTQRAIERIGLGRGRARKVIRCP